LHRHSTLDRQECSKRIDRSVEESHKVVLPVGGAVLVARSGEVVLGEDVVVGMVFLELFLLALLGYARFFLFLGGG